MRWRIPGEDRVDPELTRIGGRRGRGYVWFVAGFAVIALIELYGYFFGLPTDPRVVMLFDALLICGVLLQIRRSRAESIAPLLRSALSSDEQTLERMLDRLHGAGTHVVSQIPGDGFELADVVVCDRAVVIVQRLHPGKGERDGSRITFRGNELLYAGRPVPHDPVRQMRAQIAWLRNLLQQLTGDHYPVRGALLFPGVRVDPMPVEMRRDVWIIETGALPGYITREPIRLAMTEVLEAASQLRRFSRSRAVS